MSKSAPKRKDSKVEARVPDELKEKAEDKARSRGWTLASVIRALLEFWTQEDVVDPSDIGRAADRAPKSKKSGKPKE